MLSHPISVKLPLWEEHWNSEPTGQLEWFERLFGQAGDGVFLQSLVRLWRWPAGLWGNN